VDSVISKILIINVKIASSMGQCILVTCKNLFNMASEKDVRKIPSSRMKILTKDAKQMVNGPYYCPKCRKELLQILADVKNKEVYAVCKCGLEWQLTYAPVFQPIDYYNKFRDLWKKKVDFIWCAVLVATALVDHCMNRLTFQIPRQRIQASGMKLGKLSSPACCWRWSP